jgi:hypothetical protein
MKPKEPSCEGFHFAVNPYDSHNYIDVHYDENNNQIPADRPMHENSTPEAGSFDFSGKQYSDDWDGGYKTYGVMVDAGGASREQVTANAQSTERGKES